MTTRITPRQIPWTILALIALIITGAACAEQQTPLTAPAVSPSPTPSPDATTFVNAIPTNVARDKQIAESIQPTGSINSQIAPADHAKADDLESNANMLYLSGQYEDAITAYLEAIKENPSSESAHIKLAVALIQRKSAPDPYENYLKATHYLTKAIDLNPNNPDAYAYRAQAFYNMNTPLTAEKDFRKALSIDPNHALANFVAGNFYFADEPALAIEKFSKAITAKPDLDSAYYNRAAAYANIGDYQSTVDDYTAALRINPQFSNALINRGRVHSLLNQPSRALEDYNAAIKIDPQAHHAYAKRADLLVELGYVKDAIVNYQNAIEIYPEKDEYHAKDRKSVV